MHKTSQNKKKDINLRSVILNKNIPVNISLYMLFYKIAIKKLLSYKYIIYIHVHLLSVRNLYILHG